MIGFIVGLIMVYGFYILSFLPADKEVAENHLVH